MDQHWSGSDSEQVVGWMNPHWPGAYSQGGVESTDDSQVAKHPSISGASSPLQLKHIFRNSHAVREEGSRRGWAAHPKRLGCT